MADVIAFLDKKAGDLFKVADQVWEFAEVGFQEHKSSKVLSDYMRKSGFSVETGVAGVPTAFIAEWGHGRPLIGYLGEFDALAGVSQEAFPERKPRVNGAPGHGCGHNVLGAGALGAALGLRHALEGSNAEGTVRYYGCPAEELLAGKVYMARAGVFDALDVAITWHGGSTNTVRLGSGNGMNSAKFRFHGKTAHAAGDPQNGRSALDAVELMNVGANYLREHVLNAARIHYVITDGGGQPNVVPAEAEAWYFVRAPHRNEVEEIYERLVDVAKGAALMTGTTFDIRFLTGCYEVLLNEALADVMWRNLQKVGPPGFDGKDMTFAEKLAETFDRANLDQMMRGPEFKDLKGQVLNTTLVPPSGKERSGGGSTDVGDVSWIVPTVQMSAATVPFGCPGHSWQNCASSGSPIGKKAMLVAAKTMALCGFDLVEHPEEIKKAKTEFDEKTKDQPYKCPFPKERELPLNDFFR